MWANHGPSLSLTSPRVRARRTNGFRTDRLTRHLPLQDQRIKEAADVLRPNPSAAVLKFFVKKS
jgi:hypothetical protein